MQALMATGAYLSNLETGQIEVTVVAERDALFDSHASRVCEGDLLQGAPRRVVAVEEDKVSHSAGNCVENLNYIRPTSNEV
jgi:hypothetical protein